jgi:hypothetical protein
LGQAAAAIIFLYVAVATMMLALGTQEATRQTRLPEREAGTQNDELI